MPFFQEWSSQIKSYNQNIKLSILANVFAQIGFGIFMVIYNFYIRELGYAEQVNGQVISLTSLATALILVLAGMISDRFGRKKVMLMGSILTGIVFVLRGVFEAQTLLLILAFITGLTMAFIQVSSIPWLAENSKSFQRVHLFSIYSAVMTGASVIGNLFGGIFTDVFSLFLSPLMSIRVTLIIAGLFYFSSFIPILKFQENRVVKKREKAAIKGENTAATRRVQNHPPIRDSTINYRNWSRACYPLFELVFCR